MWQQCLQVGIYQNCVLCVFGGHLREGQGVRGLGGGGKVPAVFVSFGGGGQCKGPGQRGSSVCRWVWRLGRGGQQWQRQGRGALRACVGWLFVGTGVVIPAGS
jgi:hypothetical protein